MRHQELHIYQAIAFNIIIVIINVIIIIIIITTFFFCLTGWI